MNIFEFGCGNSTIWYSSRVKSVKSVEHDEAWMHIMSAKLPDNTKVVFKPLDEKLEYSNEVRTEGMEYHIIIIDGRYRNRCAKNAVDCLTPDGIIVWDNSEVAKYQEGMLYLTNKGFKRIDFWGMCPIIKNLSCTTIFYRAQNCIGI